MGLISNNFIGSQESPIIVSSTDPDVWDMITEAKRLYIENDLLPEISEYIPQEVFYMWKLAKKNNIIWNKELSLPHLSDIEFNALMEKKQLLFDLSLSFIQGFSNILDTTEYNMLLCDENGVMLSEPSTYFPLKGWKNFHTRLGDMWSVETVGCTAHTLSLMFNRPAQIIGPINYCQALENNISSSAPIYNEYGDVTAILILVQVNAENSKLLEHSLGWVTSTAAAISCQLRLLRRHRRLKLMDSTLEATFAHAKEGYVSVDESGYILNINKEASRLLGVEKNKTKTTIYSLVKDAIPLEHSLQTGRAMYGYELEIISDSTVKIIVDIEPFHNKKKKHAEGAIIKIVHKNGTIKSNKTICKTDTTFENIISNSIIMEDVKDKAKAVATKPINILLLGESGTGKELFAQALHNYYCKSGPFVAINCAAIPHSLIESELFGYEQGAFTGADKGGHKGKIEHANGGTLFLDEIGDMPLGLQAILLRVLEEKIVVRVGGHQKIPVDFRIISATNRSLYNNVDDKKFRQDLYFRLSMVNLVIPPLRERGNDILLLADNFIKNACECFNLSLYALSPEVEKILLNYNWPGNVRQLQNAMIYAIAISKNRVLYPENLPEEIMEFNDMNKCAKLDKIKEMEKDIISKAVEDAGSVQKASKHLGISRATIYRRLRGET